MSDIKNTHGGAGRGQGRKRVYAEKMKGRTVNMTDAHWEMLAELGGTHWIRVKIEAAARKRGKPI